VQPPSHPDEDLADEDGGFQARASREGLMAKTIAELLREEGRAEAEVTVRRKTLLELLQTKFGRVPAIPQLRSMPLAIIGWMVKVKGYGQEIGLLRECESTVTLSFRATVRKPYG
jgi:hypothetical protein